VDPKVVALEEGVVPEGVDADAGLEAEVDQRNRSEAGLVIWTERKEVVDLGRKVRPLRRTHRGAQRLTDDVLAREIQGEEDDPRDPQRHVAGGRRYRLSAIVGQRSLR
jgi:hypothetical protein